MSELEVNSLNPWIPVPTATVDLLSQQDILAPSSHPTASAQTVNVPRNESSDKFEPPSLEYITTDPNDLAYVPPVQEAVVFSSSKIMNRKELVDKSGLPLGALFTPLASLKPAPPCLRKPAVVCRKCSAFIHPYCNIDFTTGIWTCTFCKNRNENKMEYGEENSKHSPELLKETVEYLDPSLQQPFSFHSTHLLDPAFFLLIDLNIPAKEFTVSNLYL